MSCALVVLTASEAKKGALLHWCCFYSSPRRQTPLKRSCRGDIKGSHLKKWTPRLLMPSINLPGSSPMGSSILLTEKKMELPAGCASRTA